MQHSQGWKTKATELPRHNLHPCPLPHHSPIPSRGNYLWFSGIIISLVFLIIFTTCVCIPKDYSLVLPISVHCYHSFTLVFYTVINCMNIFYLSILLSMTFKLFSVFATTNNAAINILDHVSWFLYAAVSLRCTLDNKNCHTECASSPRLGNVFQSCTAFTSLQDTNKPTLLVQRRVTGDSEAKKA